MLHLRNLAFSVGLRAKSDDISSERTARCVTWPESASDHHLSAKLVSISADRGMSRGQRDGPYCCILAFLDRSSYFFFQVAPQLYSRG
jgi:hypothetical protein